MLFVAAVQLAILLLAVSVRAGLPHAPPPSPSSSSNPSSPLIALPPAMPPPPPLFPPQNDYGFRYSVNDFKGNEHSHQQTRTGNTVTGQYKVLLPDGRLQTVTYIADEAGYRAKVDYTPARPGEATTAGLGGHPPPPVLAQQPPPPPPPLRPMLGAGLLNAPLQRTASSVEIAKEKEELSPKATVVVAVSQTKPERTVGVETVDDVERIDVVSPEAVQQGARMVAPITTGLLDSSRIVSSIYNARRRNNNNNNRPGRLNDSRPRYTIYERPFDSVSQFAY